MESWIDLMLVREAFTIELHLDPAFHVRDGNSGLARSLAQKRRVRMVCSPQHPVQHHIWSSTSKVPLGSPQISIQSHLHNLSHHCPSLELLC